MKLIRCRCGDEHECVARLSNRERAVKAAKSRVAKAGKNGGVGLMDAMRVLGKEGAK